MFVDSDFEFSKKKYPQIPSACFSGESQQTREFQLQECPVQERKKYSIVKRKKNNKRNTTEFNCVSVLVQQPVTVDRGRAGDRNQLIGRQRQRQQTEMQYKRSEEEDGCSFNGRVVGGGGTDSQLLCYVTLCNVGNMHVHFGVHTCRARTE